jgi:hypothetical protein
MILSIRPMPFISCSASLYFRFILHYISDDVMVCDKGRVIGVCIGRPDDVGWEINALHSRRTEGNA